MNVPIIQIMPEQPGYADQIEALNDRAFGPGRFTRTAYRLREGLDAEPDLCFVALLAQSSKSALAGSVRQTRISIGHSPALLLGPLVVDNTYKNLGIGRELMNRTLQAARCAKHAHILLVGDLPYYERFGFTQIPRGTIDLPGPVDPERLLICNLVPNSDPMPRGSAHGYA